MNHPAFEAAVAAAKARHPNNPEFFEGANLEGLKACFMAGFAKERERILAIMQYADQYQLQGSARVLAKMMMDDGNSTLGELQVALGPIYRNGAAVTPDDVATAAGATYDAVPALQREFGTRAAYVEMKRAEAEGRVRINRAATGCWRYSPTGTGGV